MHTSTRHSMEEVVLEDGTTLQRPVIRDHARGVIFTRIVPKDPDTSMIMFIRPGWENMRRFLLREATSHAYVLSWHKNLCWLT